MTNKACNRLLGNEPSSACAVLYPNQINLLTQLNLNDYSGLANRKHRFMGGVFVLTSFYARIHRFSVSCPTHCGCFIRNCMRQHNPLRQRRIGPSLTCRVGICWISTYGNPCDFPLFSVEKPSLSSETERFEDASRSFYSVGDSGVSDSLGLRKPS